MSLNIYRHYAPHLLVENMKRKPVESMRGIMPINIQLLIAIAMLNKNLIVIKTSDTSLPYFAKHEISFEFLFNYLVRIHQYK